MKQSLSIHIPTPCHESWDAMTPAQQGRFCQSCAKTVVDFTAMTDNEVLNYFTKASGNTCGRFNDEQLERPLQPIKQEKRKAWWIAAMMPLLMVFEKAGAQKKQAKPVQEITSPVPIVLGKVLMPSAPVQTHDTIKGKVVDTLGNPIPFASIAVNGKHKGIEADSTGMFSIPLFTKNYSTQVEASALGYSTESIFIDGSDTIYTITLKQLNNVLPSVKVDDYVRYRKGGFSIRCYRVYTTRDTVLKIVAPTFKLYPNPARRGSAINIDVKKQGNYSIQLFDNNGKLIQVNTFNTTNGPTQTTISIPQTLAAGMYYIRLVNEQNKKQYTDKILVM